MPPPRREQILLSSHFPLNKIWLTTQYSTNRSPHPSSLPTGICNTLNRNTYATKQGILLGTTRNFFQEQGVHSGNLSSLAPITSQPALGRPSSPMLQHLVHATHRHAVSADSVFFFV